MIEDVIQKRNSRQASAYLMRAPRSSLRPISGETR
jgi:hypothetical protein